MKKKLLSLMLVFILIMNLFTGMLVSAETTTETTSETTTETTAETTSETTAEATSETTTETTEDTTPVLEAGYLSELKFTDGSGSTANIYEMTPAFAGGTNEYTVVVPSRMGSFYAWATLSEDAPEGSTITAKWVNLNNNSDRTQAITSAKATGQSLVGAAKSGNFKNAVAIEVGTGEDIQTYNISIIRSHPLLSSITLADGDGNVVRTNETFAATTNAYTAVTVADKVVVTAVPADESYTVTYNGSELNEIALEDGENVISVVVKNEDGYENTYTVTVTKAEKITVTFKVTPEDAVVDLKDNFGARIWPNENGEYELISSVEYTYTAAKKGYVGQKNTFALSESGEIEVVLTEAEENTTIDKTIYAQWANFRNGENHLGITDAPVPYAPEDAELLWAEKYGTGWSAAPGAPIIVDDCIVTYVGSTIKKLDMTTGEIVKEGTMVGSSSYSIVPATYAEGIIFVGLSGGRIQAFKADTLESLWVYKDTLGGQPNCPITYKDGYIYAGFWNSETRDANFACISVTDENINETTEEKSATWTYTRAGGFYWAGAYATDKYVVVGTDDGQGGYITESASLLVFDRFTGKLIDSENGFRGDIRSNVSYDPTSDRVFFTTKGGQLCNAKINWETGEISSVNKIVIVNSAGTEYAMSTCTPSVYNGRIYIGIAGQGQFSDNSGHAIGVYSLAADGTMTQAYAYSIMGYPQTSAMVTTAYAAEDGSVYIYLPYNAQPGGVSVLKDKPGQTAPVTTTDSGYSEVFTPQSPLSQYCICSTIADEYGTIYYKNDSLYMMAITSKILNIEVVACDNVSEAEDGTITTEGLEVAANLKNGLSRDISDYVTVSKDAETESYVVSYTYGLDHENYGLKTLTAEIEVEEDKPVQDENGVYLITSAEELQLFRDKVNAGETAISAKLMADIDLAGTVWTPMGSSASPFAGDFDGNGFAITNMAVQYENTTTTSPYQAFIASAAGTSADPVEIKNLTLNGTVNLVTPARGTQSYSGGLCGKAVYTNFENVTVDVDVTQDYSSDTGRTGSWARVGGFAGMAEYCNFTNCKNTGDITGCGTMAGFAGYATGCRFENCANSGNIAAGGSNIGGIVGETYSGAATVITNCYNTGNLSSTYSQSCIGGILGRGVYGAKVYSCYNAGDITGVQYVGGLVGESNSSSDSRHGVAQIHDSYNVGHVTGSGCTGGLIGKYEGSSRSYNKNELKNCYNAGIVTDDGTGDGTIGAVVGFMHSTGYQVVENVYYLESDLYIIGKINYDDREDSGIDSKMIEKTADEMKADGFAAELSEAFKLDSDCLEINSGYPVLAWQATKAHQYDEGVVTKEATCEEKGEITYTCADCGHTYTEATAKVPHDYKDEVVAPDCTHLGYTIHTCNVCSYTCTDSYTNVTEHTYESEVTKEATCTEEGVMTYTCKCGKNYTQVIPMTEHSYEEAVTAPTHDKMGYTTHTCSTCNNSYVDSYTDALEHAYESEVTKAATCTEEGEMTFTCECGESYTQVIPVETHNYETEVTAPTCASAGYTTYTCSVCDHSYVNDMREALGHDYEEVITEATHDEMGYTTHTCTTCDHSYVDSYTEALDHAYESEVTKAATCTEEGEMTFTCECGESYTQVIPKAEHDCKEETVAAGCETYGYVKAACQNCDYVCIKDILQPVGHKEVVVNQKGATYSEEGYTGDTVCENCEEVLVEGKVVDKIVPPSAGFIDVYESDWYYNAVNYAAEKGLMSGLTETVFAPSDDTTRAMMAAILYRLSGSPSVEGLENTFEDVIEGEWYYDAVVWAASVEVVSGFSETMFGPGLSVTREQMVAMLYRYADVTEEPDMSVLEAYADFDKVSGYAKEAVAWAIQNNIVNGMTIDGQDMICAEETATRAQIAAILMRYIENN